MLPPSGGIFDYDRKIVEIQDEERITHQADFWNKPKEAEVILKNIRTKKVWTDAFDAVNKQVEDLEVLKATVPASKGDRIHRLHYAAQRRTHLIV